MNKLAFVLLALAFFGGALAAPAAPAAIKVDCNKPPQSDPDKCCKTPMFFKDDLVASCDASIKAKSTNVTAECMATCLLTKNNVLDAQGSMKKDALTAFLIKTTNDAAWNKALTSAANACVNDAAARKADFAQMASGSACGPYCLFGIDCLYMNLFKSCPADRWSKTANCAQLKNYVDQCSLV